VAPGGPGRWARVLLLTHLALSPVVFSTATSDAFDHPKTMLLELTALALVGLGLSAWLRQGTAAVLEALRPFRRDPVTFGLLAGLAVAVVTTISSYSPRTSLWGGYQSFSGLCTTAACVVLFGGTLLAFRTGGDWRRLLAATSSGAPWPRRSPSSAWREVTR